MIETTELYNGEVVCEFNAARHTYTIVNKGRRYKVPSVTRITSVLDKSGPLVNWAINNTLEVCKGAINAGTEYTESYLEEVWKAAKGASAEIKRSAADSGKAEHQKLEDDLRRFRTGEQPDSTFTSGAIWLRDIHASIRGVEQRIFSRRHRYSGTFDALVESRGSFYLIDWKTSKSIYPEFRLQTAAYVHAYEEEFPDQKIEGRYLVRISDDGIVEPHYFPRATLRKDFQAFLGAKALWDRVQVIEKEARKALKNM